MSASLIYYCPRRARNIKLNFDITSSTFDLMVNAPNWSLVSLELDGPEMNRAQKILSTRPFLQIAKSVESDTMIVTTDTDMGTTPIMWILYNWSRSNIEI